MGKTSFNRLNHKIKSWRIGDYFRQFSIVAAGIIVTFWGNDRITENARQKEVTMESWRYFTDRALNG